MRGRPVKPVIEIRGLTKKYALTERSVPYRTLRESLMTCFGMGRDRREIRALDDVWLDISPGEKLGIVGENGAGKTTLLKVLSRITPPTRGAVLMRGKTGKPSGGGHGFPPGADRP